MAVSPSPQPARATQATPVVVPDYVVAARKADAAVLNRIEQNPIYKAVFEGNTLKEVRAQQVVDYLLAGLEEGKATPEELDERRRNLNELNAAIQILRKQLGAEQAHEITSKAHADFQQILNDTEVDVGEFQGELAPLCDLAALLAKYGATGNMIENIQTAKRQKQARDERIAAWWHGHEVEVLSFRRAITALEAQIATDKTKMERAWVGKAGLQAGITNAETDLAERKRQLAEAEAKTPPEQATEPVSSEAAEVNEEILELQNIGGPKFKEAMIALRDHTEEALAKMSVNFDAAVAGLTNAREAYIKLDRNCGEATFALSVLEFAVQEAEVKSREIAKRLMEQTAVQAIGAKAELDRMEREARSDQILTYTSALTTFLTGVGIAVTSLRSGKVVIQNILRMNQTALEQANIHKITGIANTAEAVTNTIGSIIQMCNQAASQALTDGLNQMRRMAQTGSDRLVGGTVASLKQQNVQLEGFIQSVGDMKTMIQGITENSVGLLKRQFELVAKMRAESGELAAATTDAQRVSFAAHAGLTSESKPAEPPPTDHPGFRMRIGQPAT